MALLAATITALKNLHGEQYLIQATNRSPTSIPTVIDNGVLEASILMSIADFDRRGYFLDETSIEVQYYALLYIVPRHTWSLEQKDLATRRDELFPHRHPGVTGTALDPSDDDSRHNFSDEKLAALDIKKRRPTKPSRRGMV